MYLNLKPLSRLLLSGVAAVPLLAGFIPQAQAQTRLTDGIKAYWNFNEDNANDSAGGPVAYNGSDVGAPTYIDGKFGHSLHLDGAGSAIQIDGGEPDDLAFAGGSMSISVWFKSDGFDKSWQALVAKGENANWRFHRRGDEQGLAFTGGTAGDTPTGAPVNDGQWHHAVAISDKDAAKSTVWIDGVLSATLNNPGALSANGKRMLIGENPDARNRYWKGDVDDLALWDRPLTEPEIAALWNGGAGREIKSFFVPQIEILGVGKEFLLGGDLTDPENDGLDALGAKNDPSWNWVSIASSHEPDFEGGENAFNIFDNKVGGGNDKWCCDDPTPGNPVWVAVQFPNPVSLTHFTVTSGNDTPGRDPTDWAIQGSDDGTTYTDIYHMTPITDPVVPWTARNQVVKFTLPFPATPYRYIRYIAYETPANLHQINEIEYFGNVGGSALAYISGVNSTINTFSFRTTDAGTSEVDPSSVKLVLDGANIPLGALTKDTGIITASYTAPSPFLPKSKHTYSITAKDGFGNAIKSEGEFTTVQYALLGDPDKVTPNPDMPGFIWNVHQNQAFTANDNVRPEQQLAGKLGVNLANPDAQSIAVAPGTPGATENDPIMFEIAGTLSLGQSAGSNGAFPDDVMPGIPGTTGSTDGIAAEILYFVELPAGPTTMIVNSDDGFRTSAGLLADVFKAQVAGEFSGGRGAADTAFTVFAATPGVYAFRTIWEEGGGGANIELVSLKEDGTKVLINDVDNGGLRAYRAIVNASAPTVVSSVSPAPGAVRALPDSTIEVVITEGNNAITAGSIALKLDNATVTPTINKVGNKTTVSFKPATPLAEGPHTATIAFTAGSARSDTWSFTVPRTTKDVVHGYTGLVLGGTAFVPGHTGTADDKAVEINRRANSSVLVDDASFLNGPGAANTMTFTFWQKLVAVVDQSVFWAVSPSSPSSSRGFQAHTPWSNNRVYFDTAGCCGGGETRIDQDIATFADYTDATFWNQWHLFGFSKSGDHKEIWIDGKLFHQGENTAPLPTDFTQLYIGADNAGGNNFNGSIDDFAVYGTALTEADYAALLGGTKPDALGAIAYWPFDGPPAVRPKLSIVRNANGSVTVTFEGDLYVSDTVNGPYVKVAGAVSPLTVPATAKAQFAKAIK